MSYEARRGLGKTWPARRNARMEELQDTQRIRLLAAKIETEAQFQKILDDVEPQAARDEVERRIRPYLRLPAPAPPDPFVEQHNASTDVRTEWDTQEAD